MTAKLGGGVESDRSSLEDFLMQDVSVYHVANVVREGRDLESYGGYEIDELIFGVRFTEFCLRRRRSCCTQRLMLFCRG